MRVMKEVSRERERELRERELRELCVARARVIAFVAASVSASVSVSLLVVLMTMLNIGVLFHRSCHPL